MLKFIYLSTIIGKIYSIYPNTRKNGLLSPILRLEDSLQTREALLSHFHSSQAIGKPKAFRGRKVLVANMGIEDTPDECVTGAYCTGRY